MKKTVMDFRVVENRHIHSLYSLLRLTPCSGERLPEMLPGQFVQVAVDTSKTTFLRRPISINMVDREANELWLLVRRTREGSGGGVGVAPLLYFGRVLREAGYKPEFLLGARSSGDLLELEEFEKLGPVYVSTDDGSAGEKGVVTLNSVLSEHIDMIYCCGPAPMMKAVARVAREKGSGCEVSLENMMACGLGACLCCVEKTVKGNVCVCTEGPVFNINQLTW